MASQSIFFIVKNIRFLKSLTVIRCVLSIGMNYWVCNTQYYLLFYWLSKNFLVKWYFFYLKDIILYVWGIFISIIFHSVFMVFNAFCLYGLLFFLGCNFFWMFIYYLSPYGVFIVFFFFQCQYVINLDLSTFA